MHHSSGFSESITISERETLVKTMGQTLTEPVTAKETSVISNDVIHVGCSSMQGWRISILYNSSICHDYLC